MGRNPRTSITQATAFATTLGYKVRESDSRHLDNEVTLDISGFGQLIEVRFTQHPDTGYLRFKAGYLHSDSGYADRITSWIKVEDELKGIKGAAAAWGWTTNDSPED